MARTVLVTGARRGIGRAIALAFGQDGWNVVLNDLHDDVDAQSTRHALPRAAFVQADIADLAAHDALLEAAFAAFGTIDCLVNNAGISVASRGDMLDATPQSFDRLIATNLRGPFFLTQSLARRWLAEPGPARPGPLRSIVNIASANAEKASVDRAEYCLSKSAIPMMTRLFALRLAEHGIAVYEVRPGIIRTDMTAVAAAKYDRLIAEGISPIRRWGEPEDVAQAVLTLASGRLPFTTGEAIHVDGGLHIPRL